MKPLSGQPSIFAPRDHGAVGTGRRGEICVLGQIQLRCVRAWGPWFASTAIGPDSSMVCVTSFWRWLRSQRTGAAVFTGGLPRIPGGDQRLSRRWL